MEQIPGRRRGPPALRVPERGDLRPDECPLCDEEVCQRARMVLVAELAVVAEELTGQVRVAPALQVHHQERGVGQDVAVPEVVGEGQAVEDAGAVVEAEDVVAEQVTVTVAYQPLSDPLLEEWRPSLDVSTSEGPDAVEHGRDIGPKPPESVEVLGPPVQDGVRRCHGPSPLVGEGGFRGMEGGDDASHVADGLPRLVASVEDVGETAVRRHALHHDHGLELLAIEADRPDASVHVRRQTTIELDLPLACLASQRASRLVEYVGPDGFRHLVRTVLAEDHPGDVGLVECRGRDLAHAPIVPSADPTNQGRRTIS